MGDSMCAASYVVCTMIKNEAKMLSDLHVSYPK